MDLIKKILDETTQTQQITAIEEIIKKRETGVVKDGVVKNTARRICSETSLPMYLSIVFAEHAFLMNAAIKWIDIAKKNKNHGH